MKIWLLQISEILPIQPGARRMRSGLLAEELGRRGHEVSWWVSGFDHLSKKWVLKDGTQPSSLANVRFEVLHGLGYKRNVSVARIADHLILARRFKQRAATLQQPDLIIANLPEHNVAYAAARYAKEKHIPLICDLRDLWPDFFLDAVPFRWLRPLARLVLARDFMRSRYVLRESDLLVTMMPSFLSWAYNKAGRAPKSRDRVFMLGAQSLPAREIQSPSEIVTDAIAQGQGKLIALFIGSFSRRSYPRYLLEAARVFSELKSDGVHFIIAGDGAYMDRIGREWRELENVSFTGWVQDHDIRHLVRAADVGVVTANEELDALPNKVFTYLSGGLPIVNSIGGDAATLIAEHRCGINIRYDDVSGLVAGLATLERDRNLLASMAASALALFENHCSAERIYAEYADQVEALACGQ